MPYLSRRRFTGFVAASAMTAAAAPVFAPALASTLKETVAVPQAIHEGAFVELNGARHWISIRGQDRRNPVLLVLQGGPGLPATIFAPLYFDWEAHYTLVQWDQPGGGATHARAIASGGDGPLTVERYLRDSIALSEHLRTRLGVQRIALFGISWGTRLGAMMIHARPDLFSHYVGTAQVISGPRGGRMGYDLALEAARARNDQPAVAALTRIGPPPYASVQDFFVRQQYTNPPGQPFSPQEIAANADAGRLMAGPAPDRSYIAPDMPTYDGPAQFLAVQQALFQETWSWEISSLGDRFAVPMHVIQGENDWNTPAALAREWVARIHAPDKTFQTLPGASHNTVPFHAELLAFIRSHVT
jgi:pimeloyl-ACP methyl ester carboxylesterase